MRGITITFTTTATLCLFLLLLMSNYTQTDCLNDKTDSKKLRHVETDVLAQKLYIFAFSTGHVGTTTFSSEETYCQKSTCPRKGRIFFRHEHFGLLRDVWTKSNYKEEYEWVKNSYFPHIVKIMNKQDKDIYFDSGHTSLYYADGLMRYITREGLYRQTTFLRIRRHRHEAAVSLTYNREEMRQQGITKETYQDEAVPVDPTAFAKCTFSPFLRKEDVIIKMDGKEDVWNKFSPFQKGLWVVDETEEQWLRLLKKYPKIKFRDIYFESEHGLSNNTMGDALLEVADVLGLTLSPHEVHTNVHVTESMAVKLAKSGHRHSMKQEDKFYRDALDYHPDWFYLPPTYNSFDDPPIVSN